MLDLTILTTIIIIHFLSAFSPGPDFFMIVKQSLTHGRRTGVYTAFGLALGITVHIAYSIAGVALIISQSIVLYSIIKYLGALYLMYIGIKSILAKKSVVPKIDVDTKKNMPSRLEAIRTGFLTNILNPKVTLFFLSLFTIVISPDASTLTLAIGSVFMILDTFLWFCMVAFFFTQQRIRNAYLRYEIKFNKAFGGILLMLGLKVASSE